MAASDVRRIRLRYPATCELCQAALAPGIHAYWRTSTKSATCRACILAAPIQPPAYPGALYASTDAGSAAAGTGGAAGSSAEREAIRRRSKREQEVRRHHPRLGGLILALTGSPQSTEAWSKGARGERHLGAVLDRLAKAGVTTLHDRCLPGRRSNIDHLAITPNGVWVIDAKMYRGRVERRDKGRLFRADHRLYVAGRDRSRLVDSARGQVAAVRGVLKNEPRIPIHGALCFVDSDWSFLSRPFMLQDILICWPRALGKRLAENGPLDVDLRQTTAATLAAHFPLA